MSSTNPNTKRPYIYWSFCRNFNVSSDEVLAEFALRGLTAPASLLDLTEHGCRYAHQDFDVMSAAIHTLADGNDIIPVYTAIWERRYEVSA